jgi:hypothetical protein
MKGLLAGRLRFTDVEQLAVEEVERLLYGGLPRGLLAEALFLDLFL